MKYNYNYRDEQGNPAPRCLIIDGCQVWNPTSEQYAAHGFLPYTPPEPVPPTEEEIAAMHRQARIDELKQLLADSDYKAIKYAEGWISAEDYATTKAERQAWREEINSLEADEHTNV